ncbi:MAG: hypothetical protein PHS19_04765 [Eubacteriales bacterium]|nr:hypothetical protein [Eubacteriales bacterium]
MFDFTDPGFLAFMESEGCANTREGNISRVAKVLNESPNDEIGDEEFRKACRSAGVDPDSFSQEDIENLQSKLR